MIHVIYSVPLVESTMQFVDSNGPCAGHLENIQMNSEDALHSRMAALTAKMNKQVLIQSNV